MNKHGLFILLLIIYTVLALCVLTSCRVRTQVVTERLIELRSDTVIRSDSVTVRDSIYFFVGDTIVRERWRTEERVKWREITRVDTIYRTDSIVAGPTENLSSWDKFRLRWFNILVAVALGLAIWTFRKPIIAFIRDLFD